MLEKQCGVSVIVCGDMFSDETLKNPVYFAVKKCECGWPERFKF
jgi:hypothetical protein